MSLSLSVLSALLAASASTTELDTVQVTASKSALAAEDVSTAVSVVDGEEIFSRPNALLPDLLRGEAGVFVQQTTPGQGIPIIRGMKGSQNLHLVDGMRVNTAFFRNAPNQYLALVDPFMAERLEVVRGPASVLYGGDALGGVVNLLTREPAFVGAEWQSRQRLFASFDGADEKFISHYGGDFGNERIASSLGVSYQHVGSRRVGGGAEIPYTAYDSRAFNNKWVFSPDANRQFMLDFQFLKQPETPRVDALVPGFAQSEAESELFLFKPNQRRFVHARYRDDAMSGLADSGEFHLAWQEILDQRVTRDTGSTTTTFESNSSDLFTAQGFWRKGLNESMDVSYGFDFNHDTIASARSRESGGVSRPVGSRFPDDSRMRGAALYADLFAAVSARSDLRFGMRYSDYAIDLNSPDAGVDDTLSLSDLTWHLGYLYRLSENDRLFANLGRGFRPPNIFDLGQIGPRSGNRFNVVNPNLKPEKVITLDLGWKHAGGDWYAELVAFVSDYTDKITSVETGELSADNRTIVRSENVGEVLIYGLESSFNIWSASGLRWFGTLNYTWGEEDDGTRVRAADRIPPLSGRLGVEYVPLPDWSVRAQVNFAARQNRLSDGDVSDPRIDPDGSEGFAVADVYATWLASPEATLRMGVANVFDRPYREHGSGLDAAGRNLHFSMHYLF